MPNKKLATIGVIPDHLETIQEVIDFLKTLKIKKKVHGLKSKFRFLKNDEIIEKGDYHHVIGGYGFTEYKSGVQLHQTIYRQPNPEYPVRNEVDIWLKEHPEWIRDAGKLLLLATLFDAPNPVFYPVGSSIGEFPVEYVNRVFLRKI